MQKHSNYLGGQTHSLEQFKIGTVTECNLASYTIDVMVSSVESYSSLPIINMYGGWQSRDVHKLLKLRGAAVVLMLLAGQYHVLGTLPVQVDKVLKDVVNPILEPGFGGDTPLTYDKATYGNYHGGRSNDILDGDKVVSTGEGTTIGLFQGGVALLKASPLAQIILGKYKDFIRMIGRRFQVYSDFGEMYLEQTDTGRVRASIHGGADLATESHPKVAKWTIQSWLGDDPNNPDNRLHIRVNDVANAKFVTLEFDINGDMFLETSNDRNATHGNNEKIDVTNNRDITVGNDQSNSTGNNLTADIGADRTTSVGGNDTLDVGSTLTITSGSAIVINSPSVSIN